jgi:hypothetical protein
VSVFTQTDGHTRASWIVQGANLIGATLFFALVAFDRFVGSPFFPFGNGRNHNYPHSAGSFNQTKPKKK